MGRQPWWKSYSGRPVIVGHYWRSYTSGSGKEGISIFEDHGPFDWLGIGAVMCVDYSVGRRARERREAEGESPDPWTGTLAALRTGVWELAFDDRDPVRVGVPR